MTDRPRPQDRPFRFGVVTTGGTEASRGRWADYARRVEDLGFSVLLVADHFLNNTVCTPRLAAAATVTSTIRLGSYVYDNDFRHPVLLAREAADIDVLSGGRMELGVGAGWAKEEYDAVGIAFDEGRVRVDRYQEAVEIIRRLHTEQTVTHTGKHYRLRDCELLVEPVQHPIPLLLGGGGPRMSRFAAHAADTIAFVPKALPGGGLDRSEFSAAAFDEKIEVLDRALGAGDGGPERAILAFHAGSADGLPSEPDQSWTSPETMLESPYGLFGDADQMVDTLHERRARWGLTYWSCWEEDLDLLAPVIARLAQANS